MHEQEKLSVYIAQENQVIVYFGVHGGTGVSSNSWWQTQTNTKHITSPKYLPYRR